MRADETSTVLYSSSHYSRQRLSINRGGDLKYGQTKFAFRSRQESRMDTLPDRWLQSAVTDLEDDEKSRATKYLTNLASLIGYETCSELFHNITQTAQVTVIEDCNGPPRDARTTNALTIKHIGEPKTGVIIVNAISAGLIGILGAHFNIDPRFFIHHAYRPPEDSPGQDHFLKPRGGLRKCKECWHIDCRSSGTFHAVPVVAHREEDYITPDSRLSFYAISEDLCKSPSTCVHLT